MITSLVVAASLNNVIGKNNQLLWHLPNDMKFFKNITWAMPVIMGRKTFESFAGKSLPGRFNIVVTRQEGWNPQVEHVQAAKDLPAAIVLAAETDCKETFVIGGGEIYKEAIAFADKIYLTRVDATLDGDTYFPAIDESAWQLFSHSDFPADEKHAYAYSFQLWTRKIMNYE
jgi:dihydrofolate reductase